MVGSNSQFLSEGYKMKVALTQFWGASCALCLHAEDDCSNHYLPFAGQTLHPEVAHSILKEIFAIATVFVYMCVALLSVSHVSEPQLSSYLSDTCPCGPSTCYFIFFSSGWLFFLAP